jgi:hypothetical protein
MTDLMLRYMRLFRDMEIQYTWMQSGDVIRESQCRKYERQLVTSGMTKHGIITLRKIAAWDVWEAIKRGEYNYE